MSIVLTEDELEVSRLLAESGIDRPDAVVAVVMTTREHARPRDELTHILRAYQGIEKAGVANTSVDRLVERGWLRLRESYGMVLVEQAPDLRRLIAAQVGEAKIGRRLKAIRQNLDGCVEVIGAMSDEDAYLTYLQRLGQASSEILLPMLATSPSLNSIPVLQERASNGVRIRILLAQPAVVGRLRGESQRQTAVDAIRGWAEAFRSYPTVEIRLIHHIDDAFLATCMQIDETILRLDVYDPYQHRSLQGILVEFRSEQGTVWNITRAFRRLFDIAWRRALPLTLSKRLGLYAAELWQLLTAMVLTVCSAIVLVSYNSISATVLFAVLTSAAGSFFVNWLIDSRARIWEWVKERWASNR
jgi:hypothetical protein